MKNFISRTVLALGVAATVTVGVVNPVFSAPVGTNTAALKEAAPSGDVIEVRRRHRHYRNFGGALLGLGAAALIYNGINRHPGYYHRGYRGYGHGYSHNNYTSRVGPDCSHRGRWVC